MPCLKNCWLISHFATPNSGGITRAFKLVLNFCNDAEVLLFRHNRIFFPSPAINGRWLFLDGTTVVKIITFIRY